MPPNRLTDEQQERALKALVLADGNVGLAKRRLDADGLQVAERTLREWRTTHASRLEALSEQRDWVTQGQAESFESLVDDLTAQAQDGLSQIAKREDWAEMNIASLGKYVQSLITSAAIATDKARLLRDKPTQITESRDLAAILKGLDKFKSVVTINPDLIDGTAEEIVEQKQLKADE